MTTLKTRAEYDRNAIARATHFVATIFLGRGTYVRASAPTIEEAREKGRELARSAGKPAAMIYAILPDTLSTSIHVENVSANEGDERDGS